VPQSYCLATSIVQAPLNSMVCGARNRKPYCSKASPAEAIVGASLPIPLTISRLAITRSASSTHSRSARGSVVISSSPCMNSSNRTPTCPMSTLAVATGPVGNA
jgi:hypothetical protein